MDPDVYGRPPIECSSFIATSAHPDKTIHGQGYLARLSGSTAEFLRLVVGEYTATTCYYFLLLLASLARV